ncbi:TonB-dependent receptor [Paraferrimonas sp. SM1919]|uniref:TonB-dependent receptor n=1 Tax=Paraferrimonas sp. SM1919 TaxID=2662263 RepID=UPI0013D19F0E|nr:TonB-dependent receptor [Paraferrimonas sp. SM1919]
MKSKIYKHTLIAASVSALFALSTPAFANSATGSIYGQAEPGEKITYTNTQTGVSRTITISENGRFNVKSVPPGIYVVKDSSGNTQEIRVNLGSGAYVSFGASEIIEVTGSRVSTIDATSSESSFVFDASDVERLPVARDSVSVALLAPGAIQGGSAFGRNLPSFGGASIAENGYYIDGMDVTNLRTMLEYATLPQDAIQQTEVKSGGLGAEYGRSLGGIINVVTKSGTNEWEFGGSVFYEPQSLRSKAKNSTDYLNDTIGAYRSEDTRDALEYNIHAGGALIEDTLFFFGNVQGQKIERDNYSKNDSYQYSISNPKYMAKLNWYITEDHSVRFTHINNETDWKYKNYTNPVEPQTGATIPWTGSHGDLSSEYEYTTGGTINIAGYTGYLTDDITLDVMYGKLESKYAKIPNLEGDTCAYAWDTTGGVGWGGRTAIGCWNAPVQAIVTDQVDDKDERTSLKVGLDWALGDHLVRVGYNSEVYDATSPGVKYSGDEYFRYVTADANENGCRINGVDQACGTETVRYRTYFTQTATFKTENTAFFVEDSWQMTDDMLLYLGLRTEKFSNYAGSGEIFVESDNLFAPRLGFAWDVNGDSSAKLFASLGRNYIPVAANTNIRATREELFTENWYLAPDGWNADGTAVTMGAEIGQGVYDEQVPKPERIADQNLKPMHQDELIVGYQQFIDDNWSGGVKFTGRMIQSGMDDYCGKDGFARWAADNGHTNFDRHDLAGCVLINPGEDVTLAMDLNHDGTLTSATVPASYLELPKYERNYAGLEFTLNRELADSWQANFSYVLSRTWGNAEGYVNTSLAQEDAGATQDFDHANFMDGAHGDLPTDRRHQFKAYGLYEITDELYVSANASLLSGTPLSCQGYVSLAGMDEDPSGSGSTDYDAHNFSRYGASSFYCKNEAGQQVLNERGGEGRSNWLFNLDMGVTYAPSWVEGLAVSAKVFNILDRQEPTVIDQQKDMSQGNNEINPGFLKPVSFQTPRYVLLSARYSF